MAATVNLVEGQNSLDVQSNLRWQGVDYIELIPVTLEAEDIYSTLADPGSQPTGEESHSALSGGSSAKLWDIGDKIRLTFYVESGDYILKARIRTPNRSSFYANGYTYWVNGAPVNFTGDVSSISSFNAAYGGSYWGDMVAQVTLQSGQNFLDIQSNLRWQGVDYIEMIPVSNSSARIAVEETSIVETTHPFIVYPNPVSEQINVSFPVIVDESVRFTLIDAFGKVYLNKKYNLKNVQQFTLDLPTNNLKTGIYNLKVRGKGFEKSFRLNKE